MSEINKYNYEAWLLDYAEGSLTDDQKRQVEDYLKVHPEAQAELDSYRPLYLQPDTSITFDKKEMLKKTEGGGKIVFFNFGWGGIAAAAAILLGVIAIYPVLFPSENPASITASSEAPLWDVPVMEGVQSIPQTPEVDRQTPATNNQLAHNGPAVNTGQTEEIPATPEREVPSQANRLSQRGIASISLGKEIYYYSQSSVLAGIPRNPETLNYLHNDGEKPQDNNLINNILRSEVARVFVPEVLEDELPEKSSDKKSFAPTIYLELPPAGKKLVDKIFK